MDPQLTATILAYSGIGIGLIIGLGALGACVGVGIMCSRFLEGAARQPELMPQLQAKVFLLLGLIEILSAATVAGEIPTQGRFVDHALRQSRQFETGIVRQYLDAAIAQAQGQAIAGGDQDAGVSLPLVADGLFDRNRLPDRPTQQFVLSSHGKIEALTAYAGVTRGSQYH